MLIKVKLGVLFFLIFICVNGLAQVKFSPKELRSDVDFFKEAADKVHPGHLFRTNQNEVNHVYRLLINDLTDSLDIVSFFKKFNLLIQSYGDLHTYASYKNQFSEIKYTLPFTTYSSNGKLWVLKSFTPFLNPSDEIISINDRSIKSIIQEMMFYTVNPDKSIDPTNVFEIRHAFSVFYALYFNNANYTDLSIRRDGKLLRLNIKQLEKGDEGFEQTSGFNNIVKQIYGDEKQEVVWNKIDSLHTIYLKLHSFDSFLKHNKQQRLLFKEFRKTGYNNLIIDVRDNPGGNYMIAGFWLEYLVNKKFNLVDTAFLVRKEKIAINKKLVKYYTGYRFGFKKDKQRNLYYSKGNTFHPKKRNEYKGNVYVLTNAQSMSTASIFAGFIKNTNRGILIGEETGNNYCAFCAGGKLYFELPNTHMRVQLPLNLLMLGTSKLNRETCEHGVLPDIEILESLSDRINSIDVQLLHTIKLIKAEK